MNAGTRGRLGITLALLFAGSCAKDPLSDLDGQPADLVTDASVLNVAVDSTGRVTATVLDARGIPLEVPITFVARSSVVTATVDQTYHPVPVTSARVLIRGGSVGSTYVIAEGGGIRASVRVNVQ
jgi:hypothetical protein